jgi:hypothetical protein
MIDIITKLLEVPANYFWSDSTLRSGIIVLGGHDGGRDYGQFDFDINDKYVTIGRSITDGLSSGTMLSPLLYSNQTYEYSQIKEILNYVKNLLADQDYLFKRETNRTELLQNTFALLPQYSG